MSSGMKSDGGKQVREEKENLEPNDVDEDMRIERFGEDLNPLKEDLAEWLSRVLEVEVQADNFMDYLDNGVLLCKLAQLIQKAATEWIKLDKAMSVTLPSLGSRFHQNAKSGTFFARDNAAYFLKWCKGVGIQDSVMFESDGLVLQKQPREVLLCLLDVARFAANFGIDPPNLVKLEKEIDEEIEQEVKPPKKEKKPAKPLAVDDEVFRLAKKYSVKIERIKEGRYIVENKINIFVRIVRNHVMVRVGGGWDTLEHFISRHDPKKLGKILTSTPAPCPNHHHGDIQCKGHCVAST
ncbi:GAS2-like protein pickled eggs [Nematostella vectensis]|uniref:GAS2-like protein pickled eggs n=1 Tax=Nematostella vectensis TaxID=45351 RepID=UPI00207712AC|nr:GAS2-like protein pickled eggs [Nematostella vectensis]